MLQVDALTGHTLNELRRTISCYLFIPLALHGGATSLARYPARSLTSLSTNSRLKNGRACDAMIGLMIYLASMLN